MLPVFPLAMTGFDLSTVSDLIPKVLGRSLTRAFDIRGEAPEGARALLLVLSEFRNRSDEPKQEFGNLLRHASMSFFVVSTGGVLLEVAELTELAILSTEVPFQIFKAAIISGNLLQWKDGLANCLSEQCSPNTGSLAGQLYGEFKKMGLREIWSGFRETASDDGRLLLSLKK